MKKKVLGGDRIPNYNPTQSAEFKAQSGKGRPRGRRNNATIERERSYAAGYAAAIKDFSVAGSAGGNGKRDSNGSIDGHIRNIMENPVTEVIGSLFGPGALLVSGIAAQWMAEETIKLPYTKRSKDDDGNDVTNVIWIPYPPILHSLFELVETVKGYLVGADMSESTVAKRAAGKTSGSTDAQITEMLQKQQEGKPVNFWDGWALWSMSGQTSILSGAGGGW